ncbi:hypothetical protein NEPAR04_0540 [Nematocida parisii]|nr:hypothetical protein NEPAR03_0740 [Nematocida parisii]KAI5128308.1 hypothetical protein NEPAR08_1172 [Nematocida parisii]KAI5129822.1 hypothetical protein NEPAR08_1737 [Nematocida parisii]KAI5140823.1 hypothetical protein NEPAR04_0540 [Nematocida parisii]
MKWTGCTLRTAKTAYKFEESILGCGRICSHTAVVLERSIVFVEKSGEIIKYPTGQINSCGILSNGVIYSEENSKHLIYITHPYETVHSYSIQNVPFNIVSADKDRFVLLFYAEGRNYLNVYKGAPPAPVLLFSSQQEDVLGVWIRGTRHLVAETNKIIIRSMRRRSNESEIKREGEYIPVSKRVESVVPIKMKRGAYFLVNGQEVVNEYGLVINLAEHSNEQQLKCITQKALSQIEIIKQGKYNIKEVTDFIKYTTKGQRLFSSVLPSKSMHGVLRSYTSSLDSSLDNLLSQEISLLSKRQIKKISVHLEGVVHLIKSVDSIKTPLFGEIAERIKKSNRKMAYLFRMLSSASIPDKALIYELFSYDERFLHRSKNLGYVLIQSDQSSVKKKEASVTGENIAHTLDDPEHIQSVPNRLCNTGIIEECKRLLSGHQIGDFLFDVYDTENRRKKAFVFSTIASVGRGVFLLNRNSQINVFQVPQMKVFLKKNNHVVTITDLTEWDSMWPSFHFAVATALSIPNRPFISTSHIDVMSPTMLMSLAGAIFGFGLKTSVCQSNLSIGEKLNLSRSLILSLSKSHDTLLIAATILGNSFIIKGTGNKDHAAIIWFNMRLSTSPGHLLMWSVLSLGILYIGQDDLFAKKSLIEYMQRRGVIVSKNNDPMSKKEYYDKYHRVAAAFSFAYITLGSHLREYIRLPDRTCEIIVNGLVHMRSGWEKISSLLEEIPAHSIPLNRFYSSLMIVLVLGTIDGYEKTFSDAVAEDISVEEAYSIAGKIFGYGLLLIPEESTKPSAQFLDGITNLLYRLESSCTHSILLDYSLLASCLLLNASGDLCLLSICQRLLDSVKCVDSLAKITDFCPFSGIYREQYGMRYGRIQHIKMCLSILAPGCGSMRLSSSQESIAFLVTSFYPEFPLTPEDQDAFQVIRHFYLLSLAPVDARDTCFVNEVLPADIENDLLTSSPVDKKAAVDIITSYFEKNKIKAFDSTYIEALIAHLYSGLL